VKGLKNNRLKTNFVIVMVTTNTKDISRTPVPKLKSAIHKGVIFLVEDELRVKKFI